MRIYIVRHGQSLANIGQAIPNKDMPDNKIPITEKGEEQAYNVGEELKDVIPNCNIYHSPYTRTVQTTRLMLLGANLSVKFSELPEYSTEDPRIREVDVGTGKFHEDLRARASYGWFFYRFPNGENPCEVYDRVCSFYSDAMVECLAQKKDMLVVSHGMTIRAIVMRALRLNVDQFNQIDNPDNCRVIKIAEAESLEDPVFVNRGLGVTGIDIRKNRRDDYSGLVEM